MQNKNLPWGEYGYFLELHNVTCMFTTIALFARGFNNKVHDHEKLLYVLRLSIVKANYAQVVQMSINV